ncbi:MAG: imidazole glycerol phosphate synthase subunit HisH [candidate division WS1 bacterium]|jgi:glutamine amidotransferase|nr:imidazole glycerol phosphate synthase subunit HisH [candidate division WS1 bacterium]
MIALIDYGMGNLGSVSNALRFAGCDFEVTSDPKKLAEADGAILPGVGAFGDCMENLREYGLVEPIREFIASDRPFLGICLGLQLLFSEGEEMGTHRGLDVVPGRVIRFTHSLKIPQIGWNQITARQDCPQLEGVADGAYVYFVHSYHVVPEDESVIATTTDYGYEFCSAIRRGNLFATQFHPEKSSTIGLQILRNFVAGVTCA